MFIIGSLGRPFREAGDSAFSEKRDCRRSDREIQDGRSAKSSEDDNGDRVEYLLPRLTLRQHQGNQTQVGGQCGHKDRCETVFTSLEDERRVQFAPSFPKKGDPMRNQKDAVARGDAAECDESDDCPHAEGRPGNNEGEHRTDHGLGDVEQLSKYANHIRYVSNVYLDYHEINDKKS